MSRSAGVWTGCVFVALAAGPPAPALASGHGVLGAQRGVVHSTSQSYLGIDVRDVGDEQVLQLKLKDTHGAEIIRVDHDGPAGKMGLREHDVVLQMNGVAIDGEEQLRRMLHDCPPGRAVALMIGRDGQVLTLSGAMADRAEVERQVWEQHLGMPAGLPGPQAPALAMPADESAGAATSAGSGAAPNSRYSKSFLGSLLTSPTYTGLLLEMIGPQLAQFFGVSSGAGLLVRSVADNSPAAVSGLKAGDVVERANGRPMVSMSAWAKMIREAKGRPVTVVILHDRQERTLVLTPDVKHKSSLEYPPGFADPMPRASL